jgi:hypothetical protein
MAYLATLAAMRERCEVSVSDTSSDAFFGSCLDRASAIIEAYVGHSLRDETTWTEYLDGDGSSFLNLRQGPVATFVSLSDVTYSSTGSAIASTISAGDYFVRGTVSEGWKQPAFIESAAGTFTSGRKNYQAVYTAGYAVTSTASAAPADLQDTCLYVAVWLRNKRKDAAVSSRDVGGGSLGGFRTDAELYADLEHRLAPYMDRRFA